MGAVAAIAQAARQLSGVLSNSDHHCGSGFQYIATVLVFATRESFLTTDWRTYVNPMRRVDSDQRRGRVRLLNQKHPTLEASMPVAAHRSEASAAIRTDLGAIFASLELSQSKWLITSLSPGGVARRCLSTRWRPATSPGCWDVLLNSRGPPCLADLRCGRKRRTLKITGRLYRLLIRHLT